MQDKDKKESKKITIIFNVSGEPFEVETNVNAPLKSAVEKAINESENTGRPISDWIVKWNGKALNINEKVENLGLPDRVLLTLSLNVGEGGNK